jgi:signal transduction histidine kinase
LAQNSIYAVYRSHDGALWAGTLSAGVSRFDGNSFKTYTTADGLASNTVASIAEDSSGAMWFATPNGLSSLSKDRWSTYTLEHNLPSVQVNTLLVDSRGALWVGTAKGLALLEHSSIVTIPKIPSSLKEQILGITEDRSGSFWIATASRVVRVHGERLQQGTLADGDFREFGIADGLYSVEGVKRHRSVVAASNGRVWFSLHRGLSTVDPLRLLNSSVPAIAHVQSITVDGVGTDLKDRVDIPRGSRRVKFGYAGLSLSVPERVRFRYILEGFDKVWSEPTTAHEAEYTNLDPGPYRFRVVASNPDGVWSNAEATVAFDVHPAFWQRGWFQASAALVLVLGVIAGYRYRLRSVTRQLNIRFDERLNERTRIAQDLHDTLLQGFLSASMQLHVAFSRLPDESPVKPSLNRVLELIAKVTEEGRNAVQGLRSSGVVNQDLDQAFSRIKHELDAGDDVEFRVIVEGRQRPLHPLIRDEAYRIGREALVNAFHHAQAKSIEVELDYSPGRLRILVRDDGRGIDPDVVVSGRQGHWGLSGMRERAERIGATVNVWSRNGAGTEVELQVPANIAFQDEHGGRNNRLSRGTRRRKSTVYSETEEKK